MSNKAPTNRRYRNQKETADPQSGLDARDYVSDVDQEPDRAEVVKHFENYTVMLDAHHNLYERIVKISRDITIESKRVIFLLHRIDDGKKQDSIVTEAEQKLKEVITNHWSRVATELKGKDPFKYLRAYSPGLQEFIEASSFLHFISYEKLISFQAIEQSLTFSEESRVTVPLTEYLLGICDLLGELMRWSINAMGRGETEVCFQTCSFLRSLLESLMSLNVPGVRDFQHKLHCGRQSLRKVEMACYALQIRGREFPKELVLAHTEYQEPTLTEYYD